MASRQHNSHMREYLKIRRDTNQLGSSDSDKDGQNHSSAQRKKNPGEKKDKKPSASKSSSLIQSRSRTASSTSARPQRLKTCSMVPVRRGKPCIDWLPDELLLDIFEYLTPQDLLSCARVCNRWHTLANDNLLWQDIYKKYAKNICKQKGAKDVKKDMKRSDGADYWKSFCLQQGAEFRNNRAKKLLQHKKQPINPFTGLPKATNEVLQKCGVQLILCFIDVDNNEHSVYHTDMFYFNMSVCARWYDFTLPSIHRIKKLRIYAGNPVFLDDKGVPITNSPHQRSIMYECEFKLSQLTTNSAPVAEDEVVKLFDLPDGITVATWKGGSDLAFIAVSFPADCLVQRCLHGNSTRPWIPPRHKPFKDDIDSKYGLHGFNCTLELRNMRNSFWSQQFQNLHALEQFKDGHAVLQLINPDRSFERSWVDKKLYLPWKTEALKGIVKDLCMVDITLLDDQSKPMWCSSGLVKLCHPENNSGVTYEYDGDYFTMTYQSRCGKIRIMLIWEEESKKFFMTGLEEEESKKFFMTGLEVHLSLALINGWFSTHY